MNPSYEASDNKVFLNRAVEAAIRIGLILVLAAWCFQIVRPFLVPIIWGIIIAIACYPGYRWLQAALGARPRLAATLFTVVALVLLITPTVMLAETLINGARGLAQSLIDGTLVIPPPPQTVASWPIIGEPLAKFWGLASGNLEAALREVRPQIQALGGWLLSVAAGTGLGIVQFVAAIIIAGVLLANASAGYRAARAIATRLAGARGADFAELAEATVRSVARGILGVAFLQALLAGLGFLAVGVPAAGLWALLCMLLGVIQIGIALIVIPLIIYVFSTADTVPAMAFLIWNILIVPLDNILKPMLLGRGVQVPMVVIFVGTIGGFLSLGIIGLFLGSVILALGYKLFLAWLNEETQPLLEQTESAARAEP